MWDVGCGGLQIGILMPDSGGVKDVMRIGLFGGSFDPVHEGHLAMAREALNGAKLDEVVFVPAARNPLKTSGPVASAEDRVGMLKAALAGESWAQIDDFELRRAGPSYTIHTVRHFRELEPEARLYWILGSDHARSLGSWYQIEELKENVIFLFMKRPGSHAEFPDLEGLDYRFLDNEEVNVSASEVRQAFSEGREPPKGLPQAVKTYIREHQLYI